MLSAITYTHRFLLSTLLTYCFVSIHVHAHPAPLRSSVTCHGPLLGVHYQYKYGTDLILNNLDQLEPAGFSVAASVAFENLWQDTQSYLLEITLDSVQFKPRADVRRDYHFKAGPVITGSWPVVLANIEGSTGQVRTLYVIKDHSGHSSGHRLEPTQLNLIVSLLNSLRSRFSFKVC